MRRKKVESLDFKDVSKGVKREIKAIERLKDNATQLERYADLKEGLDEVFQSGSVQRAVEKLDADKDTIAYNLRPATVSVVFLTMVLPILYSVSALTSLLPVLAPIAGGIAVTTSMVGRYFGYRSRAKELGMTPQDVKYARKMKVQQGRVERETRALTMEAETQKNLENLRGKFNTQSTAPKSRAKVVHNDNKAPTKKVFQVHKPVTRNKRPPPSGGPK